MKSKKIVIVVVVCVAILVTGLWYRERQQGCEIHPILEEILEEDDITHCELLSLADYKDVEYYISIPTIEQEEIEKEINDIAEESGRETQKIEFVQEYYACDTVEELYRKIENYLLQRKKVQAIMSTREKVMDELLDLAEFDMSEDEVTKVSLEFVRDYEIEATVYNLSLEQYCNQVLGMDYETFFDSCYEQGERYIKTNILIGAIAEIEGIDEGDFEKSEVASELEQKYQKIVNEVYSIFIKVEEGF